MASFDDLPADQKAVLSMVLKQGRNFDQIAALTGMDRAGVRQRALEGFDALGPETTLEPLKRALITDYLLGQLPAPVARNVATSLADSPAERAWARIIAAEISPLSTAGLPEIPAAGSRPASADAPGASDADAEVEAPAARSRPARRAATAEPVAATATSSDGPADGPRSSRRGGAILLAVIVIVIVIVVVVLVATGSSSKKKHGVAAVSSSQSSTTAGAGSTATTGSGTSTSKVTPLHTIEMVSPSGSKTVKGGADVVKDANVLGLVILGEGLAANNKNAYGVWLYNSKTQKSKFLGFYGQKVTSSGKSKGILEAEVKLPSGATAYNEILLTLETQEKPTTPGTIVLEGQFAE